FPRRWQQEPQKALQHSNPTTYLQQLFGDEGAFCSRNSIIALLSPLITGSRHGCDDQTRCRFGIDLEQRNKNAGRATSPPPFNAKADLIPASANLIALSKYSRWLSRKGVVANSCSARYQSRLSRASISSSPSVIISPYSTFGKSGQDARI